MFLKENTPESTKKSKKSKKMEKPEKCPLCCENLEPDDLNFLPCPCGYKVCLFCWNRIRTSESDPKCPLCRRTYSENPAKFEPLSAEQLQKLKSKKKQEDVKKKQKLAEDRKQLADVRVVRRNLIFVNDLPLNFSKDPKLYQRFLSLFRQAGHIKKVSILNSSKNYAGQKAPYARAYITFQKNEEALKALKLFENVEFEGKDLKLSLGTTKYCSNYIKNVGCTNKECVYLHEQADTEATFTKEQIHAGKHVEYSQKLYEHYLNTLHTKSLSTTICEERKSENQCQHIEDPDKDIIIENSICASTSQPTNQSIQIERSSSPTENNSMRVFQEIMKESSVSNNHDQCDALQHYLTMNNTPVNNSSNNSTDLGHLGTGSKLDIADSSYEERFGIKRDSIVTNGDPFHEERVFVKKESLLSRLNLVSSHNDSNVRNPENFRSSFTKGSHNHVSNNLQNSIDLKFEFKDDCGLDFDPVQMALGGLGELVISEKQKSRIEINSMNPVNAFKKPNVFPASIQQHSSYKSSNNQPLQQKLQQHHQPIFSPNSFVQSPSTVYQQSSRSQNSPVVDFYNQSASFRPVQTAARSSINSQTASQRSQVPPFPLSVQPPRFSPGMSMGTNSMVNGYSPQQQYISQISPQEAYLLSHQQNQSFENFSQQQQFSNFEQIPPSPVFSVNQMQNQSIRDFGGTSTLNMSVGQRIRNEVIGRQQSYQQQQQLQRLNAYCNSAPHTVDPLSKGSSNTFIP